jgi:hypothetical protein
MVAGWLSFKLASYDTIRFDGADLVFLVETALLYSLCRTCRLRVLAGISKATKNIPM